MIFTVINKGKITQSATVRVTVAASEFKFVLSKKSIPVGSKVIFTVINKGKISHDFRILGKQISRRPQPGPAGDAHRHLQEEGPVHLHLHAAGPREARHEGRLRGRREAAAAGDDDHDQRRRPRRRRPPPPPPPPTGPVGTAQTTVQVGMFEYRFELSQSTIPSGQVTFVITNKGSEVHNFAINGGKSGALLAPGKSETWTVALPAGTYNYVCDVPFHAERGMVGDVHRHTMMSRRWRRRTRPPKRLASRLVYHARDDERRAERGGIGRLGQGNRALPPNARQHRDGRARQARRGRARARVARLRGPRAARGRAGNREDGARPRDRPDDRGGDRRAHPVHARPPAHRRHRPGDLQPEDTRLRVPARAGLRQRPARRRDQPGDAEDAVGAARGDGRAPGDGGRGHPAAARPVLRDRDRESDRAGGHVSPARGAARPLRAADVARLPPARRRGADRPGAAARAPAQNTETRGERRRGARAEGRPSRRCTSTS